MGAEVEWDFQIYSDADKGLGCGLYWQGHWCAVEWPQQWKNGRKSIAFSDFLPLVVALALWGDYFENKKVLFNVENMAVVQIVNR